MAVVEVYDNNGNKVYVDTGDGVPEGYVKRITNVPVVGSGTEEDPYRPDVKVEYRLLSIDWEGMIAKVEMRDQTFDLLDSPPTDPTWKVVEVKFTESGPKYLVVKVGVPQTSEGSSSESGDEGGTL
mgnify:CR=1 FL=1